jgi:hypothetical protein
MGYYCDFEIRVEGMDDFVLDGVGEQLEDVSGGYGFETYGDAVLHSADRFKWYDHERDLAVVSEMYPDHVFDMRVVGEDGERWQVFAKNGKVYSQYLTPQWGAVDESRFDSPGGD